MLTVIAVASLLLSPATPALASDPVAKTVELLNAYRAKHGAGPLSLDSEVSRTAQEWADHLHETDGFEHRPDLPPSGLLTDEVPDRSRVRMAPA